MTVNNNAQRYGSKYEWLTPPYIFEALGVEFDLDPCSPIDRPTHVPAALRFTQQDNGLELDWIGRVWLNPPFGTENYVHRWLKRFFQHGDGLGIIRADTSTSWWRSYVSQSKIIVLPEGRVRFINNNPEQGRVKGGPGFASALFAAGAECTEILRTRGRQLGVVWVRDEPE